MNILKVVSNILSHPISQRSRAKALVRFFVWQTRIRLNQGPHLINWIGGSRFFARAGEAGLTGNIYNGLHEFEDMCFTLHFLRAGELFLDVGANAGAYTILASKVVGARVQAFEPVRETFDRLEKNVGINEVLHPVECHCVCVGERSGEVIMTANNDAMNHVLRTAGVDPESETVPMICLDDRVATVPILMKLDVEGYELNALTGASELLDDPRCLALIVEINGSGSRYGIADTQIVEYLQDKGFQPCRYDPFRRQIEVLKLDSLERGNVIFVKNSGFVQNRLTAADPLTVVDVRL